MSVNDKICSTRLELLNWQWGAFGNTKAEINLIIEDLHRLQDEPDTEAMWDQRKERLGKLDELLSRKETYWMQCSRTLWLKKDDRNTRFFHRKMANIRRKNRIRGLIDRIGVQKDNEKGIDDVVLSYFSELFASNGISNNALQVISDCVQPKITKQMNENLPLHISNSDKEIKHALFQMHPSKAPGLATCLRLSTKSFGV